ncbi:putative lipase/esterase (putative) [Lactiplantibacillus plantarum]|nr:putative hydrolase of the alpha/betasuperfamily [Lactiplantibacillus plantarum]KZU00862.1 putative hydrolase of the alpha/betasuperfamily [Lactiplantibacillus plantarum]MCG0640596.1 putative lipase/esterase (putative) [Lactiplantibacillus plantarum]MCG0866243.1 putative lipase/esterase (putative) [Lactiplantibacillus plantarum]
MIKVTNRHFQDVPALEVVTTTHLDQPLPLVIFLPRLAVQ